MKKLCLFIILLTAIGLNVKAQTDSIQLVMKGDSIMEWPVHKTFIDPGCIAIYNHDTFSTSVQSFVDADTLGSSIITYSFTTPFMNTRMMVRQVDVIDAEPPVITVLGNNPLYIKLGSDSSLFYNMLDWRSVKVNDNFDLDCKVTENSITLPFNLRGTYIVTYSAIDHSGNVAEQKTRLVVVTTIDAFVKTWNGLNQHAIVFPNPANTIIQLTLPKDCFSMQYNLYDLTGRTIQIGTVFTSNQSIDVSQIPDGAYFLELKNQLYTSTSRFQILH